MSARQRAAVSLAAVGSLGALVGLLGACRPASAPPAARSVVLVTLDTTRVDHLSVYGYRRPTTPTLDAFAQRAVRFDRAWSTSTWTLPAHASLFTGLYPQSHGARYDARGDAVLGEVVRMPTARFVRAGRLPDEATTLAERLAARGYRSGAFVAGPWLHRGFGLLQGFEHKDDESGGFAGRRAEAVSDRAIAWLGEVGADESFFLFINYFDPHAPYDPPPGFAPPGPVLDPDYGSILRGEATISAAERASLFRRYDGEIRYMDAHLGRVLEALLARPGADRTLIIITGDHGEAFGEGGRYGHGFWLSEELLRVPLLIRFPGDRRGGERDASPVQLVDLLPLVADELGFELAPGVQGMVPGTRAASFARIYREPTTIARFGPAYDRDLAAAIEWPAKLVESDAGERVLFGLTEASLDETPADDPATLDHLTGLLRAHERATPEARVERPEAVEAEVLEGLRALGYVE